MARPRALVWSRESSKSAMALRHSENWRTPVSYPEQVFEIFRGERRSKVPWKPLPNFFDASAICLKPVRWDSYIYAWRWGYYLYPRLCLYLFCALEVPAERRRVHLHGTRISALYLQTRARYVVVLELLRQPGYVDRLKQRRVARSASHLVACDTRG